MITYGFVALSISKVILYDCDHYYLPWRLLHHHILYIYTINIFQTSGENGQFAQTEVIVRLIIKTYHPTSICFLILSVSLSYFCI